MGFFSFFHKEGVAGYDEEYDYRIDVILKCTQELFGGGDIGVTKTKYPNGDWGFSGGSILVKSGLDIISTRYKDEIDDNFRKGTSFNQCVIKICNKVDNEEFLKECQNYDLLSRIYLGK